MEETFLNRKKRHDAYLDILIGAITITLAFAAYLMEQGVGLGVGASTAPIYMGPTPATAGDVSVIVIITAYGSLWGIRLINHAITTIQTLNAKIEYTESAILPTPS